MELNQIIYGIGRMVFAALVSFVLTPLASLIAHKTKAIDVPKDDRRVHKEPIPLLGGLAIYFSFVLTSLLFCEMNTTVVVILAGGGLIAASGMADDIFDLNFVLKFVLEIGAAFIAVSQNVIIDHIDLFSHRVEFGIFSIPVTVLWIVALTNAINLIDGLDGLACGVSAICSFSLLVIAIIMEQYQYAVLIAIISGSCLGFLPFNRHPAKIFMGDTGALFLGYALSIFSIQGLFKMHAVISFIIPVLLFALPLSDTLFSFFRRIIHKKNPFKADKMHLHHRLMRMGFDQKQTVNILYAISGLLGITSVMFTKNNKLRSVFSIVVCLLLLGVYLFILSDPEKRNKAGLDRFMPDSSKTKDDEKDQDE